MVIRLRTRSKKKSLDELIKKGEISLRTHNNGFFIQTDKVEVSYFYTHFCGKNSIDIKSRRHDLKLTCQAIEPVSSEKFYLTSIEEGGIFHYESRPAFYGSKDKVFIAKKDRVEKATKLAKNILDEVYFNELFEIWVKEFNVKFPVPKSSYEIEGEKNTILAKTPRQDPLDKYLASAF